MQVIVETGLLSFLIEADAAFPFLFTGEHADWLLCQFTRNEIANTLAVLATSATMDRPDHRPTFKAFYDELLRRDETGEHTTMVWEAVAGVLTPTHTFATMKAEHALVTVSFDEARWFRQTRDPNQLPSDTRPPQVQLALLALLLESHLACAARAHEVTTLLARALDVALMRVVVVPRTRCRAQRSHHASVQWLWEQLASRMDVVAMVEEVLPTLGTESRFLAHFAASPSPATLDTLLAWLDAYQLTPATLKVAGSKLTKWDAREDLKEAFLTLAREHRSVCFSRLLKFASQPGWVGTLSFDHYKFSQSFADETLLWLWARAASGLGWHRLCDSLQAFGGTAAQQVLHARLAGQTKTVLALTPWSTDAKDRALSAAATCGCVPIAEELLLAGGGAGAAEKDPLVSALSEALWQPGGRGAGEAAERFESARAADSVETVAPPAKKPRP